MQLNCVYVPWRVPKEHLTQFLQDCPQLGVHGLSVTNPHKEAVLTHCTKVDRAAQAIGAANVIMFQDDQTIGYNTDYRAALDSLAPLLRLSQGDKPLAGHTALLLGAGGMAKAIAFGLAHRGANVVVAASVLRPPRPFKNCTAAASSTGKAATRSTPISCSTAPRSECIRTSMRPPSIAGICGRQWWSSMRSITRNRRC